MERASVVLPSGTVAFLFTDVAGSTRLWERDRAAMHAAVQRQIDLLREIVAAHGGVLYKVVGDGTQAAFASADDALGAAVEAQRALHAEGWPDSLGPLRVRVALHVGQATPRDGDYLAAALNRLARLLGAGHGGQILLTESARQLSRDSLPVGVVLRDLGAHRLRDLQEPEEVFQVVVPELPDTFPPLKSLTGHPTNLEAPPTAIIGREAEIADVLNRFDAGARLVTMIGPGGSGKTRLAQEIAAEALGRFVDGVFFVDLSPLRQAADVLPAVAVSLGVRENPGQPVREALSFYLSDRALLLVLDNCEQVLAAADDVAALLAACPRLAILATSREALRLRAEQVVRVPPLPVPEDDAPADLARLAAVPSVALFVERARAADPAFTLTKDNGPAVAAICRRLDGLPLALELAAARVGHFPPSVLLARLQRALPVLTGGPRDAPDRQRTLRQAIAWSYDLLEAEEQALFRALGVFVGGCTFASAETVAAALGDVDIFAGLPSLCDQSLLLLDAAGTEPRYRMLETIREFALERLADNAAEEIAVRRAHLAHLGHLVREHDLFDLMAGMTPEFEAPVARLAVEEANLRAALEWGLVHEPAMAFAVIAQTGPYWHARLRWEAGLDLLERALAASSVEETPARALVLSEAAFLANRLGESARAESHATAALALAERLSEPRLAALACYCLGTSSFYLYDGAKGAELLEDALGRFEASGNVPFASACLNELGREAMGRDDPERAVVYYGRALAMDASHRDPYGQAVELANLALAHFELAHHEQARASAMRALALVDEVGSPFLAPVRDLVDYVLGSLAHDRGDYARASGYFQDGLRLSWEIGDKLRLASALESAALSMTTAGRHEVAARTFGAADALYRACSISLAQAEAVEQQPWVSQLRTLLGEPSFSHELGVGQRRPPAESVAESLEVLGGIAEGHSGERSPAEPAATS